MTKFGSHIYTERARKGLVKCYLNCVNEETQLRLVLEGVHIIVSFAYEIGYWLLCLGNLDTASAKILYLPFVTRWCVNHFQSQYKLSWRSCDILATLVNIVHSTVFVKIALRFPVPLLLTWLNFNPSLDQYMPNKVWDKISYPFPNFNGSTVEVWEWISNFILHILMDVITYPCRY